MPQRKKAGCNSYANVTDDYTLYEKIMPQNSIATPTKGGVRRRLRGGNQDNTMNAIMNPSSFMQGFPSAVNNVLSGVLPQKGGKNKSRGGNGDVIPSPSDMIASTPGGQQNAFEQGLNSVLESSKGGSSCSASRRGGAIELAPFAASLAFLAARMSMDDKLNFSKLLNLNQDESEPAQESEVVTKTSRSRRSRRSVAPVE